jgi:hypothetical protein
MEAVAQRSGAGRGCSDLAGIVGSVVVARGGVRWRLWNSISVIAWLIAAAGLSMDGLRPPPRGRAPGWDAGLEVLGAAVRLIPVRRGLGRQSGRAGVLDRDLCRG